MSFLRLLFSFQPSRTTVLPPSSIPDITFPALALPGLVSRFDPPPSWPATHRCFCKSPPPTPQHKKRREPSFPRPLAARHLDTKYRFEIASAFHSQPCRRLRASKTAKSSRPFPLLPPHHVFGKPSPPAPRAQGVLCWRSASTRQ